MQRMLVKAGMVFAAASRKLFQYRGRDTPYLAFEFENGLRSSGLEFESNERGEKKG
jgi:hypothetical protein